MSAPRPRSAQAGGQLSGTADHRELHASRLRARNARILTEVLDRSQPLLLRQARKHALLPEDADEALQAACLLFIERFNPQCQPLPWLQTTVKREAWRIARRAYRHRELAITAAPRRDGQGTADLTDAFPDPDADPFDFACHHQLTIERRAALDALKPDQRLALLLCGLGYTYAEIAQSCGWTMTKVNRSLSKGRAALRSNVAAE